MYGDREEGTFVQFAPIATYDDSNQLHSPVMAIIERDDGKVVTVHPNQVNFIK